MTSGRSRGGSLGGLPRIDFAASGTADDPMNTGSVGGEDPLLVSLSDPEQLLLLLRLCGFRGCMQLLLLTITGGTSSELSMV